MESYASRALAAFFHILKTDMESIRSLFLVLIFSTRSYSRA